MKEEALEALKGSIRKWEKIVEGTGVERGTENCPCCIEFYDDLDCNGCPISEHTGQQYCHGSPYDEWDLHRGTPSDSCDPDKRLADKIGCDECKAIAQRELDFLKSLLPEFWQVKQKKHVTTDELVMELWGDPEHEGDLTEYDPGAVVEALRQKFLVVASCERPFHNIRLTPRGEELAKNIIATRGNVK